MDTVSTPDNLTAPPEVNDDTDQVIPPDCCYFCLTRGGLAAYQCHKEGADLCTRCIRDKRKKCRLPTPQESAAIAARCLRCTRQGFKACNNGDPCDTCLRNKTEHLCRRVPERKKKTRPENPRRRSAITPQSESIAPERSIRGRTTRRSDLHQNENNTQSSTESLHEGPTHSIAHSGTATSSAESFYLIAHPLRIRRPLA